MELLEVVVGVLVEGALKRTVSLVILQGSIHNRWRGCKVSPELREVLQLLRYIAWLSQAVVRVGWEVEHCDFYKV